MTLFLLAMELLDGVNMEFRISEPPSILFHRQEVTTSPIAAAWFLGCGKGSHEREA
jgi:hypothetical protein